MTAKPRWYGTPARTELADALRDCIARVRAVQPDRRDRATRDLRALALGLLREELAALADPYREETDNPRFRPPGWTSRRPVP